MKTLYYLIITLLCFSVVSCNPECDQLLTIQVDSAIKKIGDEILITTNNPDDLVNRQVLFATESTSVLAANGRYEEILGGVIYKLPEELEGENIQIQVDNPDCGLISFNMGLSIHNESFFTLNPSFIPPSPAEIVIPSPPVAFPPLVQNAWVSPQDLDYCIWFKFLPEIVDGDTVMVEVNGNMIPKESHILDPYASKEFSVRELVCGEPGTLYHNNSVSGIIDKDRNFVNFFIERSNVNGQDLGIEEFEGKFIDISQAGYDDNKVPDCNPNDSLFDPQKFYLILVRSKQTNRQLLLYQQAFL
jgi:hypothetical protein